MMMLSMNPPSLCELRRGKPLRCCALGFMVPVRAIFCVGALHEPGPVAQTALSVPHCGIADCPVCEARNVRERVSCAHPCRLGSRRHSRLGNLRYGPWPQGRLTFASRLPMGRGS